MKNGKKLPLRIGVGIVLLNHENKILVGKRIDNPKNYWQMPQGGVDNNESFLEAAKRELEENSWLGTSSAESGLRDYEAGRGSHRSHIWRRFKRCRRRDRCRQFNDNSCCQRTGFPSCDGR